MTQQSHKYSNYQCMKPNHLLICSFALHFCSKAFLISNFRAFWCGLAQLGHLGYPASCFTHHVAVSHVASHTHSSMEGYAPAVREGGRECQVKKVISPTYPTLPPHFHFTHPIPTYLAALRYMSRSSSVSLGFHTCRGRARRLGKSS